MDLKTTYMGLELKNPLIAGASPLTKNIDNFKKLEDGGVSAIVNHSLFEEQITHEQMEQEHYAGQGAESSAEALSYFPEPASFNSGPAEYLKHIEAAKKAVSIPVIGSLNGCSAGGWTEYAKKIEDAGADGLELNVYYVAADSEETSTAVEDRYVDLLTSVKGALKIPVAVKLSPYFSSVAYMAKLLDEAGADALVLFNRFYQPEIDLEKLEVVPNLNLSQPPEMRLPLRWTAILYGKIKASLGLTTGVHDSFGAVKAVMAGADVAVLCGALLENGTDYPKEILNGMEAWMQEHDYKSLEQMKGSMSQKSCADPQSFERANYMKVLQSYK